MLSPDGREIRQTGFRKREFEVRVCELRGYARVRFCVVREHARLIPELELKSFSQAINDELGNTVET
jgi:hypothetical protein